MRKMFANVTSDRIVTPTCFDGVNEFGEDM
jgi:hypothetical protein